MIYCKIWFLCLFIDVNKVLFYVVYGILYFFVYFDDVVVDNDLKDMIVWSDKFCVVF